MGLHECSLTLLLGFLVAGATPPALASTSATSPWSDQSDYKSPGPAGRQVSVPALAPLGIPTAAEPVGIDKINGYRKFEIREDLGAGQFGSPKVEYRVFAGRSIDTRWVHWSTGPEDGVGCNCPDGREYRVGSGYRPKSNVQSHYTIEGFDWYAYLDRPGEALCFPRFKASSFTWSIFNGGPLQSGSKQLVFPFVRGLDQKDRAVGAGRFVLPKIKGAIHNQALLEIPGAPPQRRDDFRGSSEFPWELPRPGLSGDPVPHYTERSLDELEGLVNTWMLTSGHACNGDPDYPSVLLPTDPATLRYRAFTEEQKDGVHLAGFEPVGAQATPVPIVGQLYVLRRGVTATKLDKKANQVSAPFPAYITVSSVAQDGAVTGKITWTRVSEGSKGVSLREPAPGLPGVPIVELKDPRGAKWDSVVATVEAGELMLPEDYLDLMEAALGKPQEVAK